MVSATSELRTPATTISATALTEQPNRHYGPTPTVTSDYSTRVNNIGFFNSGNGNFGIGNSGNFSTGLFNPGHGNTGFLNAALSLLGMFFDVGNANTGSFQRRPLQSGAFNRARRRRRASMGGANTGWFNTGSINTGAFTIGDMNNGLFNTGDMNNGVPLPWCGPRQPARHHQP